VAAQLQGLLIALAAAGAAGCGSAPKASAAASAAATARPAASLPSAPAPRLLPVKPPTADPGLGPEILLPQANAGDAVLAEVGDVAIRQSHAFARLLTANPKVALSAVDLLVFDVLVARHAQEHGIRVPLARVDELAKAEEAALREQVAEELGGQMDFAGYLWRAFGLDEADWRAALRLRCAQRLYQGYVLRYLALREDRAQVRFLAHADPGYCREVADKVRAGADFATLASKHSEDPSRRDGGLLPPFARGFQHPVAKVAFELQRGEVSAPFEASWGEGKRWFVVYCLDRTPGRDVPFALVADEIDAGLATTPISPLEASAYTLRWRGQLESAPPAARK
jgi:hypothetical protein